MLTLTRRRVSQGVLAAALMGSGSRRAHAGTPLKVAIDFKTDAANSPLFLAIDRNYFAAEGLDVSVEAGLGPRGCVAAMAEGKFDIGFGDFNALVRIRDDNPRLEMKAVAILHDQPAFAVVGRKSRGISDNPQSLVGSRLGATSGEATLAQWPLFTKLIGLGEKAVQIETVGQTVKESMLVQGEVDAVLGFSTASVVNLRARDVPPDDLVLMLMSTYGLQLYGNAIIASGALLHDNPEAVRMFVSAYTRGLRDAITSPAAAVECVVRRNSDLSRELETERLRILLSQNVLTPYVREHGFGGLDPVRFERGIDQHAGVSDFKKRPLLANVYSGDFLPDSAERRIG